MRWRSASPSTSRARCDSHRPRACRSSPRVVRCCRFRGPTPRARSRPRSTSSSTRSAPRAGCQSTSGVPTASSGCARQCTTTNRWRSTTTRSRRDEMTTRVVDPWRVFHAFGAWYLAAWCHRATAERLFRVDRIRALRRHRAALRSDGEHTRSRRRRRGPRVPTTRRRPARHPARSRPRPTGSSRATRTSRRRCAATVRSTWCSPSASPPGSSVCCSRSARTRRSSRRPDAKSTASRAAARVLARYG